VTEKDVLTFVQNWISSVYSLELLLLMRRERGKAMQPADLVRELRSSPMAVAQALQELKAAGLISESPGGSCTYAPASAEHERVVADIERTYAVKPITLVKAIMSAPNQKLRMFSDAFRIKE
jgi:hypothetical protein